MTALIASSGVAGQPNDRAAPLTLTWRRLPDMPDPVGLKGMYGGVSHGRVLLAGGSNFPVPLRAGGTKTFHAAIHTRPVGAAASAPWEREVTTLPTGLGEGASVSALDGVVAIGGHDGSGAVAAVVLLRRDPVARRTVRVALRDLPEAAANAAAAVLDGWLYVAGGEGRGGALSTFRRLDLAAAVAEPAMTPWEVLPTWPGRARFGGVLAPVTTPRGTGLLWAGGIQGPARSQADYLRDAFIYSPASGTWATAATMPRGAVLGGGVAIGDGRVLVLGGSDGHDFERMKALGAAYRIPHDVLLYDARADRWSITGTMPLGLVGAALAPTADGWLVAGGEYSPGLRTPQVHLLTWRTPVTGGASPAEGGAR